jgi:aminodeoxyfutalosine deaminase
VIRYRASWVVPISGSPIRDGWVMVDGGRIAAVGPRGAAAASTDRDLGDVALMPGLVNAHTHLELSYLRDAIPPSSSFVDWIRGVIAARRQPPAPAAAGILQSVNRAIDEAVACGTVLVGDISNTLVTFGPLARSSLAAVVFNEVIRFNGAEAAAVVERASRQLEALLPTDLVRTSLAAHAPYSVAPLVFREIRRAIDRDPLARCSVHLSESAEEVEFIRTGQGPWRAMLEELGSWDPSWVPPSVSPVQYLDDAGFLDERVLAVHGVQMSSSDLARLAARRTTLVTCPRSNRYTGAGAPPLEAFYASGVRVAVGTDSLASAPSLNVFDELAAMRELAPMVPASALLDSATRQGARALGFEAEFGSIEPGKRARLLAVSVPSGTEDVEEYLLGGVRPGEIRWVD